MNVFNKVTLSTLKKNKTRTIVTIIGIILSAAMITAITTFISSFQNYMVDVAIYNNGNWHGVLYDAEDGSMETLKKESLVTTAYEAQILGYALMEEIEIDSKPYIYVLGIDDAFTENMPIHLTSGRLPENSKEIIVPTDLRSTGRLDLKLGDSLKLSLGDRILGDISLNQSNGVQFDEKGKKLEELVVREERAYTVVGTYETPSYEDFISPGYKALTIKDNNSEGYLRDVYFKASESTEVRGFLKELSSKETLSFDKYSTNYELLKYSGASLNENYYTVLYGLSAILIGLIIFGSVSLIYNAFAISVSERTKQFGLLSSIGATKKQLRSSVLFEGFVLSIIGIPLGILSGILGIGVTLVLIGNKFSSMMSDAPVAINLHVSLLSVVAAVILGVITVFISAYIPSRRATRITAIEAIRQSSDIKIKKKKLKTNPLVYKIFGLEGILAEKHYKRNKKRYRATVFSLFISVVLFISASSLVSYLSYGADQSIEVREYDISYSKSYTDGAERDLDKLKEKLSSVEGVTKSGYVYFSGASSIVDETNASLEFKEMRFKDMHSTDMELYIHTTVYGVEDSVFIEYLEENNLDKELYMNPEKPLAIASDRVRVYDDTKEKFVTFNVFNEKQGVVQYRGSDIEKYDSTPESERESLTAEDLDVYYPLEYGYLTDELPYGTSKDRGFNLTLVYAESVIGNALPWNQILNGDIYFSAEDHTAVFEKLSDALWDLGEPTNRLTNYAAWEDSDRNVILIINVFSYGFIVLISLIAVANVFNTITTGINLRRREFAMLKSVGMTEKGFKRMMSFESILYGVKGLIYGIPVAVLVTYGIYLSMNSGLEMSFYMPLMPVIISVFSVFAVVFSSTIYSMRKIKKDNPIDALRNENL
ncbi:ABC transporter permease [Alloiococcus sp. CFN-8]|uniref:ABC transporter permease n=1 Tax=Alloiococcus sp. CFN-8 TaxID=3416081 RepID=UPI003CEC376E